MLSVDNPVAHLICPIKDSKARQRICMILHPIVQSSKSPAQNSIRRLVVVGVPRLQRGMVLPWEVEHAVVKIPVAMPQDQIEDVQRRVL